MKLGCDFAGNFANYGLLRAGTLRLGWDLQLMPTRVSARVLEHMVTHKCKHMRTSEGPPLAFLVLAHARVHLLMHMLMRVCEPTYARELLRMNMCQAHAYMQMLVLMCMNTCTWAFAHVQMHVGPGICAYA